MRPGFEISGCAEAVAPADDEPAITVPSSSGDVVEGCAAPGKAEPVLIPGKGGDAMVCVQATRGSQTPPHPPSLVVLRPVPLRCLYEVCLVF